MRSSTFPRKTISTLKETKPARIPHARPSRCTENERCGEIEPYRCDVLSWRAAADGQDTTMTTQDKSRGEPLWLTSQCGPPPRAAADGQDTTNRYR